MPTVLIVDDSPTEVHVMQEMLSRNGFETLVAEDGDSARLQAERHIPDVILMDVVMPGLNGFQATREISRNPQTAKIPIIIVSTKDQETDRIWGIRQGAAEYLTKPVKEKDLISKIRSVVAG
ncbi:MAG: response regulator [Pseudomonadota bacterium]